MGKKAKKVDHVNLVPPPLKKPLPQHIYVKCDPASGQILGCHEDIKNLMDINGTAEVARYALMSPGTIHNETYYVEDGEEREA